MDRSGKEGIEERRAKYMSSEDITMLFSGGNSSVDKVKEVQI